MQKLTDWILFFVRLLPFFFGNLTVGQQVQELSYANAIKLLNEGHVRMIAQSGDETADSDQAKEVFSRLLTNKIEHFDLAPPCSYSSIIFGYIAPTKDMPMFKRYYEDAAYRDSVYDISRYNLGQITPIIQNLNDTIFEKLGYQMKLVRFEKVDCYLASCKKNDVLPNTPYPTNACPLGLVRSDLAYLGVPQMDLFDSLEQKVWHLPKLYICDEMIEDDSSFNLLRVLIDRSSTSESKRQSFEKSLVAYGLQMLDLSSIGYLEQGKNDTKYIVDFKDIRTAYSLVVALGHNVPRPFIWESVENLKKLIIHRGAYRWYSDEHEVERIKFLGKWGGHWRFKLIQINGDKALFEYANSTLYIKKIY